MVSSCRALAPVGLSLWFGQRLRHEEADGMNIGGKDGVGMNTESVWDYPRPPRMETTGRRLRVVHAGVTIAESRAGLRVLETSHPPVYYLPPGDVAMEWMERSGARGSFCEFKGMATYWSLRGPWGLVEDVAWSYERPTPGFAGLAGYLAFYASRVDECWVEEERVVAQEGDFYGGWITRELRGPFKGAPGTRGW
jgi:uncharacterized protein (DUF427 family)